jgi:hypothetical protein
MKHHSPVSITKIISENSGHGPDRREFWFMMQIAMICGFAASYPVNWWLVPKGVKERM